MSHWWTDTNFGNSKIEKDTLAELRRILEAVAGRVE